MEHRVGIALSYPRNCRNGAARIFHLEPATDDPDPRQATNVELERTGQIPDWKIK